MLDVLKTLTIHNQPVDYDNLISLLTNYQILPHFLREMIIDKAIANINCTPEEQAGACKHFLKQHQIRNAAEHEVWLKRYGINQEQFQALATRKLRINKFQQATWGHKLESYFLQRKKHLDKIVYSMLVLQDSCLAQELYFRIQANEQSFGELAREYSIGAEANTNGIVGPVELGMLQPQEAKKLQVIQQGQLCQPFSLGKNFVIIRLEKILPAQLDMFMRKRLLQELFETWLQEQINILPINLPIS